MDHWAPARNGSDVGSARADGAQRLAMAAADRKVAVDDRTLEERMQALYDAHAGAVYRFLLGLTLGAREAAEDMLRETMTRAWRNIDALSADVSGLRPWLLTVARRIAIDASRTNRVRPTEIGPFDKANTSSGDEATERMPAAQTITQAMARLTTDHRKVIIEVFFRGRSAAEAAAILGVAESTVESRTHDALRALHAAIASMSAGR
ncbi:MAG TPA: sigma-70 family RNA polymerase sigma factor [Rugosimonospora sp.]|nr:sigma-70 family RNA polymerase sigma factor [Rugosimonospora sp.]